MQPQQSETVQLFFNGNNDKFIETKSSNKDDVYKNYIIKQNTNLLSENKKLEKEKLESEQKYQELEEETETTEKRLRNTKDYLKNFRFINDGLEFIIKKYTEFEKSLSITGLINELRVLIGSFTVVMIIMYILMVGWISAITFTCLHFGLCYVLHEMTLVPKLENIELNRKNVLEIKKVKEKEIKNMRQTMDIISEFIDNGL